MSSIITSAATSPDGLAARKTARSPVSDLCPPIHVSAILYSNPVGKRLKKSSDGQGLDKTFLLDERNSVGEAKLLSFSSAEEAFRYRLSADACTMFLAGTFDPASDLVAITPARLVEIARGQFEPEEFHKIGSATKEYLKFREGPTQLLIDIDPPRAEQLFPRVPPSLANEMEVRKAVLNLLPEATDAPMLIVPSASSCIQDEVSGEQLAGPGGWRVIVIVEEGREIPDILKTIHLRAWAREDWAYAYVDRGGGVQIRSLADQALGRPTQPDYPTADLGEGLCKSKTGKQKFCSNGPYLAAGAVVLSDEDKSRAEDQIQLARQALRPQRNKVSVVAIDRCARSLIERGVPEQSAKQAAEARILNHVILGSDVIVFADGTETSVSELLSINGADFDNRTCLDPLEPDYDEGRVVGKIYWNDGYNPRVYSFARGGRFFKLRFDHSTLLVFIAAASSKDRTSIVRALALSYMSPIEHKQALKAAAKKLGLGNSTKELKGEVNDFRRQHRISSRSDEDEDADIVDMTVCPISEPLRHAQFPKTKHNGDNLIIVDHIENVRYLLTRYDISLKYNEITKEVEWSHSDLKGGGDNSDNALMSHIVSLANLNSLPINNLQLHLTAIANENAYNPVTDYLSALVWDRRPRLFSLAERMVGPDLEIKKIALRIFFLQACAAADHAASSQKVNPNSRAHFESVIVFVGEQGVGKTKGIRKLLPVLLRKFFKEGLTLDPKNKDSVKQAISCWIGELGELDATFRKADLAQLKAFLSNDTDELRMPYAHKSSKFKRRTSFVGTVNDPTFLADRTGNRRFIPLEVSSLVDVISEGELDQVWAEAWHLYCAGELWWANDQEAAQLAEHTDRYRSKSWIEEKLEANYDWSSEEVRSSERHTASRILSELDYLRAGNATAPTQSNLKDVGASLRRLWSRHPALVIVDGVQRVEIEGVMVAIHASGGKNSGWVLPPERNDAFHPSLLPHFFPKPVGDDDQENVSNDGAISSGPPN